MTEFWHFKLSEENKPRQPKADEKIVFYFKDRNNWIKCDYGEEDSEKLEKAYLQGLSGVKLSKYNVDFVLMSQALITDTRKCRRITISYEKRK